MSVTGAVTAIDPSSEPQTGRASWRVIIAPDHPTGWAPSGALAFDLPRADGSKPLAIGDRLDVPVHGSDQRLALPSGARVRMIGSARDADQPLAWSGHLDRFGRPD